MEKEIKAAKERLRVSEAQRKKYEELKALALLKMKEENYQDALDAWNKILRFLPKDVEALEGQRKCKLAIDNRLKFEKIKSYLAKGKIISGVRIRKTLYALIFDPELRLLLVLTQGDLYVR